MNIKQIKIVSAFAVIAFVAWELSTPGTAHAQNEGPRIVLSIQAFKEARVKEGQTWLTKRVPVAKGEPGDTIIYEITYTNEGDEPAVGASIVDPVPEGAVYILESTAGEEARVLFSVDGGMRFQEYPAKIFVNKPDGSLEEAPAPAEKYTHIKWVLEKALDPGKSGKASFKVTVK